MRLTQQFMYACLAHQNYIKALSKRKSSMGKERNEYDIARKWIWRKTMEKGK